MQRCGLFPCSVYLHHRLAAYRLTRCISDRHAARPSCARALSCMVSSLRQICCSKQPHRGLSDKVRHLQDHPDMGSMGGHVTTGWSAKFLSCAGSIFIAGMAGTPRELSRCAYEQACAAAVDRELAECCPPHAGGLHG